MYTRVPQMYKRRNGDEEEEGDKKLVDGLAW